MILPRRSLMPASGAQLITRNSGLHPLALTPQITARDRLTEGRTGISCGLLLSFICARARERRSIRYKFCRRRHYHGAF
jgi:hypothetical protein